MFNQYSLHLACTKKHTELLIRCGIDIELLNTIDYWMELIVREQLNNCELDACGRRVCFRSGWKRWRMGSIPMCPLISYCWSSPKSDFFPSSSHSKPNPLQNLLIHPHLVWRSCIATDFDIEAFRTFAGCGAVRGGAGLLALILKGKDATRGSWPHY